TICFSAIPTEVPEESPYTVEWKRFGGGSPPAREATPLQAPARCPDAGFYSEGQNHFGRASVRASLFPRNTTERTPRKHRSPTTPSRCNPTQLPSADNLDGR